MGPELRTVLWPIFMIGVTIGLAVGLSPGPASSRPITDIVSPVQLAQYGPPPPGYYPYPGKPPCNVAGGAFVGAARGAAGGAAIGAIAGNAGKGAAIGAAVGGLGAAARRASAQNYGYCY